MILFLQKFNKCDDSDFKIVNFLFLDGDIPRSISLYSMEFIFLNSSVAMLPTSTLVIKQGYRYYKHHKTFF